VERREAEGDGVLADEIIVLEKQARSETAPFLRRSVDLRQRFQRRGLPIISVDPKKRELVGNFRSPGHAGISPPVWSRITTSAPTRPASPSRTASMIGWPTAAPCWWASRLTPPLSLPMPFRIGGSPKE
jgi:hypothetical protein